MANCRSALRALVLLASVHLMAAFAAVPAATGSTLGEWRHRDGDAARSRRVDAAITPPLREVWRVLVERTSQVVAAGNTLYLIGDGVTALDGRTGVARWKRSVSPDSTSAAVALSSAVVLWARVPELHENEARIVRLRDADGAQEFAVPGLSGVGADLIQLQNGCLVSGLLGSSELEPGVMLALDPDSGRVLLRRRLDFGWMGPGHPRIYKGEWPAVFGQLQGSAGWLFALSGVQDYTLATLESPAGPPHGMRWSSRWDGIVRAGEETLFRTSFHDDGYFLQALDRRCKLLWETRMPNEKPGGSCQVQVVTPESVIVGGYHHTTTALDPASGRTLWSTTIDRSDAMVGTRDVLYTSAARPFQGQVSFFPNAIAALSLKTGEELWSATLQDPQTRIERIIAHKDSIYVLSERNQKQTLERLTSTGNN